MAQAYDDIQGVRFTEPPETMMDIDSSIYLNRVVLFPNEDEKMDTSVQPGGILNDERDLSKMSDHLTVWVDKYIGDANENYSALQLKFENLQVLKSTFNEQNEIDDFTMVCEDRQVLKTLSQEYYCLKYFCQIPNAVEFIRQNSNKKIFFISSGTIGKEIIPKIYNLPQIQGIYIFCGNISAHVEWAGDYEDNITSMLEHQDNLLTRLSRDIAKYLEEKGDRYKVQGLIIATRNCYAWAKKLLTRAVALDDKGAIKLIRDLNVKIEEVNRSTEAS